MGAQAGKPFTAADITAMAPKVAPQTALQQQATTRTTAGLGAYQPYVGRADTGLAAAGAQLGAAQTGLGAIGAQYADPARAGVVGAQQTLGGVPSYITAAGQQLGAAGTTGTLGQAGAALTGAGTAMGGAQQYITQAAGLTGAGAGTGAGTISDYMSPYQQQVIDTSLAEFDKQAAMRQQAISDAAVGLGGFGGGREGVMPVSYTHLTLPTIYSV